MNWFERLRGSLTPNSGSPDVKESAELGIGATGTVSQRLLGFMDAWPFPDQALMNHWGRELICLEAAGLSVALHACRDVPVQGIAGHWADKPTSGLRDMRRLLHAVAAAARTIDPEAAKAAVNLGRLRSFVSSFDLGGEHWEAVVRRDIRDIERSGWCNSSAIHAMDHLLLKNPGAFGAAMVDTPEIAQRLAMGLHTAVELAVAAVDMNAPVTGFPQTLRDAQLCALHLLDTIWLFGQLPAEEARAQVGDKDVARYAAWRFIHGPIDNASARLSGELLKALARQQTGRALALSGDSLQDLKQQLASGWIAFSLFLQSRLDNLSPAEILRRYGNTTLSERVPAKETTEVAFKHLIAQFGVENYVMLMEALQGATPVDVVEKLREPMRDLVEKLHAALPAISIDGALLDCAVAPLVTAGPEETVETHPEP